MRRGAMHHDGDGRPGTMQADHGHNQGDREKHKDTRGGFHEASPFHLR